MAVAEPVDEEAARAPTADAPTTPPAEPSLPPSTASYEEAIATPEAIAIEDDRLHLTDNQLRGPMNAVIQACRVPRNARVVVHTAVQGGRAIGVTVRVHFAPTQPPKPPKPPKPPTSKRPKNPKKPKKPTKPPSRAAEEAQAKLAARIVACVDGAVRKRTWPPSHRRDSFVTEF